MCQRGPLPRHGDEIKSSRLGGMWDDVRTLKHGCRKAVKVVYDFFQEFKGSPFDLFADWAVDDESVDHWKN